MKKLVTVFLVLAALMLIAIGTAQAAVLDTISQPNSTALAFLESYGQSFTATATGFITKIRVAPCANVSDTLSIYKGDGYGGMLLYSQPATYTDGGGAFQEIALTAPVSVTSGQQYTFRVANGATCLRYIADAYSGGARWHFLPGWGFLSTAVDLKFEVVIEDGAASSTSGSDKAPDDRINWKHGDNYAVLYSRQDAKGNPVLHLYCIDANGKGYLGDIITQEMFNKAPAKPSTNTLVGEITTCRVPIKLYVLTTGEYQINIGPNAEGKVDVIVFTGLPPTNVYYNRLSWK